MATTNAFQDFAGCSLVTSNYKWLTNSLLTAQQQLATHPYMTCKVVDDTIQPNAEFFNGAGLPLDRGQMAACPDGAIVAAGFDGSGHVVFLKAPDLNAVAGVWPTSVTLDTGSTLSPSLNQVTISVSDFYQGSYQIDVWYFSNFGSDATSLKIMHQYSTDGGATWTSTTFGSITGMANTLYPGINLSIAAIQNRNVNGSIMSGCFYIKKNSASFASGFTGYDVYYIYGGIGSGFTYDVLWNYFNINSFDWTIHSLTGYYLNGTQYLAFAGFRNVLDTPSAQANYSIWTTAIENITTVSSSDLWTPPVAALPVGSTSAINQNAFIYPMATVQNGMVYLVCQATQVDSVSQTAQGSTSAVVTTHVNYMLMQSNDGRTFSYPSILVYTDGTEFNSSSVASFVPQAGYWYLGGGNGYLWQYLQNAIVADVSSDLLGYAISEQAGQPGSIQVQISNANNKWVGTSPTGNGASAIQRNRKIFLQQGYYNASGTPETVPHGVFYIDDIQQQVTSTQNDLLLVGRDFYKKMMTTITRFNYQFVGPSFYSDIFDGTTNNNWNQIAGTWTFFPATNTLEGEKTGAEATIVLANFLFNTPGHFMRVFFLNTELGTVYVYGMYVDANNWIRLELDTFHNTWAVVKNIASSKTTIDSGSLPTAMTLDNYYMIAVKRYGYYIFNFYFSVAGGTGNELSTYDPATQSYLFANSTNGQYSLQGNVAANTSLQGSFSVGMGASSSIIQTFKYFQLSIYNNSNNIGEVTRSFARIAGISSFKVVDTFEEFFYTNDFNGTFSKGNRVLKVTAGNAAVSSINQLGDGEISFKSKMVPTSTGSASGFKFIFRADNAAPGSIAAAYYFHVLQASGSFNPSVVCRFERLFSGTTYQFFNSSEDVEYNPSYGNTAELNLDLTQEHTFRIVAINGQLTAYIDDIMVASWNDDNTTAAYLKSGYWGFSADSNSTLSVYQVTAPVLWKPVPTFSFNPGDDVLDDLTQLATSLLFWIFQDLLGRFKTIFLSSTDPSTYTYNGQLYAQNTDQSDKEYVSQVTVYGNGVAATARNTMLMAGVPVRDLVIVDYTILTQADAQTRANNAIINAGQYLNQNAATQVINAGSEIFDVVTVINTGNNTSGVDSPTRIYDQNFTLGGGNNTSYALQVETGNV